MGRPCAGPSGCREEIAPKISRPPPSKTPRHGTRPLDTITIYHSPTPMYRSNHTLASIISIVHASCAHSPFSTA